MTLHLRIKRFILVWLVCLLIITMARALLATAAQAQTPPKPNVLFIAIDDLNTMIPIYGGQAYTPNIDRLAATGMTFLNAYTPSPICNPSRVSLFTGLRPSSTGITSLGDRHVDWRHYLADPEGPALGYYGEGIDQVDTLFDHFRKNGYFVASAGKTFHSNEQLQRETWDMMDTWSFWPGIGWPANMPLNGLDAYHAVTTPDADWGAIESAQDPNRPGEFYSETDLPDYQIAQNGLTMLDSVPDDRPFLAAIGFVLPHLPWYVPQRILDLYPPESIQLPPTIANDLEDVPPPGQWLVSQGGNFYDQRYLFDDESQWRQAMRHYLAAVTYADEQVGRILDELDRQDLADDTIVVLWSDHGYHLGEKSHLQKNTLWHEATALPLIIRAPGVSSPGSSTMAVVNTVDLFPTLVELAGLTMPEDFHRDGRSLLPLLADPEAFWPWVATSIVGFWNSPAIERAVVQTRGWSYLRYDLSDTGPRREEELYFRIGDPFEFRNLLSPLNGDPAPYKGVRVHLESILRGQTLPDAPPQAHDAHHDAIRGLATAIELRGQDPNKDYLAFTIETLPAHGQLYASPDGEQVGDPIQQPGTQVKNIPGWSVWVIYVPDDEAGADAFSFEVSDGIASDSARVQISIRDEPIGRVYLPLYRR